VHIVKTNDDTASSSSNGTNATPVTVDQLVAAARLALAQSLKARATTEFEPLRDYFNGQADVLTDLLAFATGDTRYIIRGAAVLRMAGIGE
jgi:hypothetical protein